MIRLKFRSRSRARCSDFDELAWVEKRERKHVSRVLPLALAAATEALRTAGIDTASLPLEQKRRFGVILGSGGGVSGIHRRTIPVCFFTNNTSR